MGNYQLKPIQMHETGIKVQRGSFSGNRYVIINNLIFKINQADISSSLINVHQQNYDLIISKSKLPNQNPNQVRVDPYAPTLQDNLKNIHLEVSSAKSVLSKVQIAQLLKNTDDYYNAGQYFYLNYQDEKIQIKVIRLISQSSTAYGKITESTIITMDKQRQQQFRWRQEMSNEETNQNSYSKDPKVLLQKLRQSIGGNNNSIDSICQRIFMTRSMSAYFLQLMKVKHCKGVLLYGPPGTGKTLLARAIEKLFKNPATIINGPQVLDKFVGEAQRKIREPFKLAEEDQKKNGANSETHLIIFDQIDALCRKRGNGGANSDTNDKIVNQLLTCIDGVKQLNNVFIIGMTNRIQLLDDALLRPGRLQLHIEFMLPNQEGRNQILNIHTKSMVKTDVLKDINLNLLASQTQNYTGAELQALVRKSLERGYTEWKQDKNFTQEQVGKRYFLEYKHFQEEINNFSPQFGSDNCKMLKIIPTKQELLEFSGDYKKQIEKFDQISNNCKSLKKGKYTILIEGPPGIGKTVQALRLMEKISCPFSKMISVDQLIGFSDERKCDSIVQTFHDAEKCGQSTIFLDDLLRLVEYIPLGNKFNNGMLQNILNLIKKQLPNGKKMIIVATADSQSAVADLGLHQLFNTKIKLPYLNFDDVSKLLSSKNPEKMSLEQTNKRIKSKQNKMTLKDILNLAIQNQH